MMFETSFPRGEPGFAHSTFQLTSLIVIEGVDPVNGFADDLNY